MFKASIIALSVMLPASTLTAQSKSQPPSFSGIYPSLAFYNDEDECGTGAVVPWAGSLWVITYGPHKPFGSSDKLYQVSPILRETVRQESIGGTPACRMIHRESRQLFIGPYAISADGGVRTIGVDRMPGRLTGLARNLKDPACKINFATMEQGFYEIDTDKLSVCTLEKDGNILYREGAKGYQRTLCKGVHGKGFYSGQGVYVFSNNGEDIPEAITNPRIEAGSLSENNGTGWRTVRRCQFTEVTGPGGIYGNQDPDTEPIWALGWDYKSVILAVRDAQRGWRFFRLPKASNSYDGAHGWNTEWPRIRSVSAESGFDEPLLMTMHGMFWHFPKTFSYDHTAGLRPLTNYLKVIGDFCAWQGRLVFGCDDTARSEFLNKRDAKGGIAGPGQSQSNLWFAPMNLPSHNGTSDAVGAIWEEDTVKAGTISEPYLLAGWQNRYMWVSNGGSKPVCYTVEVDTKGDNHWHKALAVKVWGGRSKCVNISHLQGEWLRVGVDAGTCTTVAFVYGDTRKRATVQDNIFAGLTTLDDNASEGGLLYALGGNRRKLGILANNGKGKDTGYYELDDDMHLVPVQDEAYSTFIHTRMAIPHDVAHADRGSWLITDNRGRRWRLPLGDDRFRQPTEDGLLRICREVATERDLFSLGGTFYELPAEDADGYAKIRPISTHRLRINDYTSYRGMLVMTGITGGEGNPHIVSSTDGNCRVWCGAIDDLWKLGRPVGHGGPWVDEDVKACQPSDPFLISHYRHKTLFLTNHGSTVVTFTTEVDPTGDGTWMTLGTYRVAAGKQLAQRLPDHYLGRWIRFTADHDTRATAWLEYK